LLSLTGSAYGQESEETVSGVIELVAEVEESVGELNSGDTAWMLTATVLVLFMTIPGLSLFYAGLVRSKNVLSVLAGRTWVRSQPVFSICIAAHKAAGPGVV